ncbi:unnamed protein product, partial [Sphacelaria rigidula]
CLSPFSTLSTPLISPVYMPQCFCGVASDVPDRYGDATCNMKCSGDTGETCGGRRAISVYEFTDSPSGYAGCFVDSSSDRVLTGEFLKNEPTMTLKVCSTFCSGSPFFGMEFGEECFCGTDSDDFDRRGASTACTMACAGDDSETCGGNNAISVYYGDSVPDSTSATFTYLGCFADSVAARVLSVSAMKNDADLTIDACSEACDGYAFFGTEW